MGRPFGTARPTQEKIGRGTLFDLPGQGGRGAERQGQDCAALGLVSLRHSFQTIRQGGGGKDRHEWGIGRDRLTDRASGQDSKHKRGKGAATDGRHWSFQTGVSSKRSTNRARSASDKVSAAL